MKKILTLLIATGAIVSVQAQNRDEARRVILGDGNGNSKNYPGNGDRDVVLGGRKSNPNYPGNYPSNNDRQYEVNRVNQEYDAKIQSIRNNGYLSADEKRKAIQQLERDRQRRLQQINGQYNERGGRGNNNNDDCNNGNNGKHKGWDKKEKNKNWKKGRGQ